MAILLRSGVAPQAVQPQNGIKFSLQELQGFVDGYIEVVEIHTPRRKLWMIVNEEGRLQNLEVNHYASLIANQTIVGNAVVVSFKEMEGREEWEPEEDE